MAAQQDKPSHNFFMIKLLFDSCSRHYPYVTVIIYNSLDTCTIKISRRKDSKYLRKLDSLVVFIVANLSNEYHISRDAILVLSRMLGRALSR